MKIISAGKRTQRYPSEPKDASEEVYNLNGVKKKKVGDTSKKREA